MRLVGVSVLHGIKCVAWWLAVPWIVVRDTVRGVIEFERACKVAALVYEQCVDRERMEEVS